MKPPDKWTFTLFQLCRGCCLYKILLSGSQRGICHFTLGSIQSTYLGLKDRAKRWCWECCNSLPSIFRAPFFNLGYEGVKVDWILLFGDRCGTRDHAIHMCVLAFTQVLWGVMTQRLLWWCDLTFKRSRLVSVGIASGTLNNIASLRNPSIAKKTVGHP